MKQLFVTAAVMAAFSLNAQKKTIEMGVDSIQGVTFTSCRVFFSDSISGLKTFAIMPVNKRRIEIGSRWIVEYDSDCVDGTTVAFIKKRKNK